MGKSIILKTREGGPLREEGVASEAITPGELVEYGGSNDVQLHSTANGSAQKKFALENDLVGDDIDDDYDSGDTVQIGRFAPGEEVQAWLAYGESVSKGDPLTSDGAGALQAAGGSAGDRVVAYAKETLANTSGGAAVRIDVEVA